MTVMKASFPNTKHTQRLAAAATLHHFGREKNLCHDHDFGWLLCWPHW